MQTPSETINMQSLKYIAITVSEKKATQRFSLEEICQLSALNMSEKKNKKTSGMS